MAKVEVCPTCGHASTTEALHKAFKDAKLSFPPNLELYDFGDGVTSMPVPDGQGSYRTTTISFLVETDKTNPDPDKRIKRALGFQYRIPLGVRPTECYDTIFAAATKAAAKFNECSFAFSGNLSLKNCIEV